MKQVSHLKEWLDERGIKQSWLSKKTGIHHSWINKLVNEQGKPTVYDAIRIAKVLDTTVDKLWTVEEENE